MLTEDHDQAIFLWAHLDRLLLTLGFEGEHQLLHPFLADGPQLGGVAEDLSQRYQLIRLVDCLDGSDHSFSTSTYSSHTGQNSLKVCSKVRASTRSPMH